MSAATYEIEPSGESGGTCDCCGKATRSLRGLVRSPEKPLAAYFMHWTIGASFGTHPANVDLIIGEWGDGTSALDRVAVSLVYFENEDGPGVMAIDANDRQITQSDLVSRGLSRAEIIGTPLAAQAFAIFDAVLAQDPRLQSDAR